MTPKEKAEQLIFKYEKSLFNYFTTDEEYVICVNCALIAVDEIINCTKNGLGVTVYSKEYWQEVKQEIEKL